MAHPGENPRDPREEEALSSASGVYNKQKASLISIINRHRGKIGFLAGAFSGTLLGAGITAVNSLDETPQTVHLQIQRPPIDGVLLCDQGGNCVVLPPEDFSSDELEELGKGCEPFDDIPQGLPAPLEAPSSSSHPTNTEI